MIKNKKYGRKNKKWKNFVDNSSLEVDNWYKSWCFKIICILKEHITKVVNGVIMKVVLNQVQRKLMCIETAKHLPTIRDLLHLNQKEFGLMCGISTDRLSRIENGHVVMTWSQLLSVIAVCNMNMNTKEYLFMNNVIPKEFFQYVQQLDETIPPFYNVILREEVIESYNALKGEKTDGDIW